MAKPKFLKTQEPFDVAIIGDDLAAWLIASEVERLGLSVVLISESPRPDNPDQVEEQPLRLSHKYHLEYYENSQSLESVKKLVHQAFDLQLATTPIVVDPITYEEGASKQFLGFGERKFKTIDVIQKYLNPDQVLLNTSLRELRLLAARKYAGQVWDSTYLTDFEVVDDKIFSAAINGAQKFAAHSWVFTKSPMELLELIDARAWTGKARQRVAKSKTYAAVELHFTHSKVQTESPAMHVLMGGKDDFEPLIGRFEAPVAGLQNSSWMSFVNAEQCEDDEFIGAVIRNMKKQIKRPYPTALEKLSLEKISVREHAEGQVNFGSDSHCQVKDFANLYFSHATLAHSAESLAHLQSAQWVIEALATNLGQVTASAGQSPVV